MHTSFVVLRKKVGYGTPTKPGRSKTNPHNAATASAPSGASDAQDWGARQVREWLLLLLRFAVTSDAKDQSAALALADEIDARGLQWRPSAPTFFRRTTKEVVQSYPHARRSETSGDSQTAPRPDRQSCAETGLSSRGEHRRECVSEIMNTNIGQIGFDTNSFPEVERTLVTRPDIPSRAGPRCASSSFLARSASSAICHGALFAV